jgi:hypothetical protein
LGLQFSDPSKAMVGNIQAFCKMGLEGIVSKDGIILRLGAPNPGLGQIQPAWRCEGMRRHGVKGKPGIAKIADEASTGLIYGHNAVSAQEGGICDPNLKASWTFVIPTQPSQMRQ